MQWQQIQPLAHLSSESEVQTSQPIKSFEFIFPKYVTDAETLKNKLTAFSFSSHKEAILALREMAQSTGEKSHAIFSEHCLAYIGLHEKDLDDSLRDFERVRDFAKKHDNQLARIVILKDLSTLYAKAHKWEEYHDTLADLGFLAQELDLIEEKIEALIAQSHFYQAFANLELSQKQLNLAKNLCLACAEYNSSNKLPYFQVQIEMNQLQTHRKKHQYKDAVNHALMLMAQLSQSTTEDGAYNYIIDQIHVVLQECYIELGNREKSIINLSHIKKRMELNHSETLHLQYDILKTEHEILFENRQPSLTLWMKNIRKIWRKGEAEFCLDQVLRALKKCKHNNTLDEFEHLMNFQHKLLKQTQKQLPSECLKSFLSYYEFKPAYSLKVSSNFKMRKFVRFSRELMREHNLKDICEKAIDLFLEFSQCRRGFLVMFQEEVPYVISSRKFNEKKLLEPNTPENRCLQITEKVFEEGLPFVKSKVYHQDPDRIEENYAAHLKEIGQNSYIVLPLITDNNKMGVIYMDAPDEMSVSQVEDVESIEAICYILAYTIYNETSPDEVEKASETLHKNSPEHKYSFENFVGQSASIMKMFDTIKQTINSSATITINGESGVGKEMIAKIIHYNSLRKDKAFVALNCAAIPENLLESELFGYKKGSFTGADADKQGLFSKANGGTIFLDEIGEMPMSMQVKLLRVLQEREVTPVGGSDAEPIDVRVVCATNRNLVDMIDKGLFREDLYYRIQVVNVTVPSLRNRKEDIPLLAQYALKLYALENSMNPKRLTSDAIQYIMNYNWPGNVRELINVMYNLSIFVENDTITLADLEERQELFRVNAKPVEDNLANQNTGLMDELSEKIDNQELTLSEAKQEFEKLQIQRALEKSGGQITSASYHLQMPRPQVSRLVKKYGLKEK